MKYHKKNTAESVEKTNEISQQPTQQPAKQPEQEETIKNIYHKKNKDIDLNLRTLPKHKSDLAAVISDEQPMYFYGEIEQGYGSDEVLHDWYKVYLDNGITGWARSDLLIKEKADSDQ